jgi:Flp pilus assembly protein TadD
VAVAVVVLAAVVTYMLTLGYDFSFDDHLVIPMAWQVGASSLLDVLRSPVRAGEVVLLYFRPLTALSYWLDGALWQGNPGGFHFTNVLLHALVSVMVLRVARLLLPAGAGPIAAGLLFAVHPVHVEAVAWVQGRVDLLSGAGVLAAILLGVAGMEATGRGKLLYWMASGGAVFLGLLAKEVAVVAPLLTAVVLAAGRGPWAWARLRAGLPLLGAQGLACLAYLELRGIALGVPAVDLLASPGLADRVLLALKVIPLYARLLLFPVGLNPKHEVVPPSGVADGGVLLGVALLAAFAALGFLCRARVPGLAAGLAWLALAWLPASNLLPIRGFIVAERFLYLPSAGACFAVAGAVALAWRRGGAWRVPLAAGTASAVLACAVLAVAQAGIWQDMQAFYEGLVRRNPDSAFAHNNLGSVYLGLKEEGRAEAAFREALRLRPGHPGALNNLGILAQRRGDVAEARRLYRAALRAGPGQPDAWNNLGSIYEAEGDVQGATKAYLEAVRLDGRRPLFLANLAGVLAAQGKRTEAAILLQRAVALDPVTPDWRKALAVLGDSGQPESAETGPRRDSGMAAGRQDGAPEPRHIPAGVGR